jgi:hypothetical protein
VQEREKRWRDSDVATWREQLSIGWKERKEGVECPIKWSTKNVYPDCLKIIDYFGKKRIIFPDSLCFPYYYFIEGKIARPNFFYFSILRKFLL